MAEVPERLESWKEIAVYLGRSSRTVQRWERTAALPVRRLLADKRASVYALRSELDAWRDSRSLEGQAESPTAPVSRPDAWRRFWLSLRSVFARRARYRTEL